MSGRVQPLNVAAWWPWSPGPPSRPIPAGPPFLNADGRSLLDANEGEPSAETQRRLDIGTCPDLPLNDRVYRRQMILLRKAYHGHYIEIRPVSPPPQEGVLPRRVLIWIDGELLDGTFACPRSELLPSVLKIATDRIDTNRIDTESPHQA